MVEERFENWKTPAIEHGKFTQWNWLVQHPQNLILGKKTDIGALTYINAQYGVEIQDEVQIGSHCSIYSVSTIDNKQGKVTLKKNARIGSHSTVLPGVTIGENSVVGAHSFVNKDIPDDCLAYGVPAKVQGTSDALSSGISAPSKIVPLCKPSIGDKEKSYVNQVLSSGHLALGPFLKKFEDAFSQKIGCEYAIAVNSGTSGLHLVVRALGIKQGDEVITSPFSFVASANCILYEHATPVFVDVLEENFNLDVDKLEAAITSRTKAIVVPHIFGQSCDMDKLMAIAKKHNLYVIEDACEAIVAQHNHRMLGTFGDVAVFAFYPNKQMTTGEGGMIVTNNEEIAKYCRSAANQGRGDSMQWLTHDKLGFNYRMDEMSAAVGLGQLERIDELISSRKRIAELYTQELLLVGGIKTPKVSLGNVSSWFVYPISVDASIRNEVIAKLKEKGIQSKAYFHPSIHHQPFYKELFGFKEGDFPVAEKLSNQTIVLPFFSHLSDEDVMRVVRALKEIMFELRGKV